MFSDLSIEWCADVSCADSLASFFVENVDRSYISHSEIQGRRALSNEKWAPNLQEVLLDEILPRLKATDATSPGCNSRAILTGKLNEKLAAISMVTFSSQYTPFVIIEDLVVTRDQRSNGIGTAVIDWIAEQANRRNIRLLMLESGVTNCHAHRLFKRAGFVVCSHVMMRTL